MKIFYSCLLSIILVSFYTQAGSRTPDVWGGYSVASSEDLDTFTHNPAGIAIDHGQQTGWYMQSDINGNLSSSYSLFYVANKIKDFGYSLTYANGDKVFNPTNVTIAFGSKIGKFTYFGTQWNKYNNLISESYSDPTVDFGVIIRPMNFISFGIKSVFDKTITKNIYNRYGFGIRPFGTHRFTVGMDYIKENNESGFNVFDSGSSEQFAPFIDLEILNGISLKTSFFTSDLNEIETENLDFHLNISFDFEKSGLYVNQYKAAESGATGTYGIGYHITRHKKNSIFTPKLKDNSRYVRFKLDGLFIEEKPSPISFGIGTLISGKPEKGQQLKKWIDEINTFREDTSVKGLIIELGNVRAGFAKKQEMYNALKKFKESGKEIIIYSEMGIDNSDYYLASLADDIYLNELTGVYLRGLSMEVTFLRSLLDTLYIVPEVFRVSYDGKSYKTAADPLINKTMSDEMRENYGELLDDLYAQFVDGIAQGRKWTIEKTQDMIDNGPYFSTDEAVEIGLVEGKMYPDEFEKYIEELNEGKKDLKGDDSETIKWKKYDRSKEYVNKWKPDELPKIALIYAVGGIISGKSNPGPSGSSVMGDVTIRKAIKNARENSDIDAIVFRIDSGGGSALASDQMWREIYKTTVSDTSNVKPFIASMSDVAASGGYYIACQADSIVANPATITGSIGVIGLRLNLSKLFNKIGINTEVLKTGEHSDFGTGSRLINEDERNKIQGSINETYKIFKEKVINGRESLDDINKLDDIAMGRVGAGIKSAENGLVDKLGGLHDAIEMAKSSIGLEKDDKVEIIEYPNTNIVAELRFQFGSSMSNIIKNIIGNSDNKIIKTIELVESFQLDPNQMVLPYIITIE